MRHTLIKWQPACCAWHGHYAEHRTLAGGVARLKRMPDSQQWLVMVFDAQGRAVSLGEDGAPLYVPMDESQALALLA